MLIYFIELLDGVDLDVGRLVEFLGDDYPGVLPSDVSEFLTDRCRRYVKSSRNLGLRYSQVNEFQHPVNVDRFFRHYPSDIKPLIRTHWVG